MSQVANKPVATQITATVEQPAAQQATAVETFGWRVIVRGTTASGQRKRYVHTVQADASGKAAHDGAGAIASEDASKHGLKLDGLFFTVYPPVGLLCNGGISKGWQADATGNLSRTPRA